MTLETVSFEPREQVFYTPNATKQCVNLYISNPGVCLVTFKLKSTRPLNYKMRPIYGIVKPGSRTIVRLIFKGLKPSQKVPERDHYSVIYKLVPSSVMPDDKHVRRMWEENNLDTNLLRRHRLRIIIMDSPNPVSPSLMSPTPKTAMSPSLVSTSPKTAKTLSAPFSTTATLRTAKSLTAPIATTALSPGPVSTSPKTAKALSAPFATISTPNIAKTVTAAIATTAVTPTGPVIELQSRPTVVDVQLRPSCYPTNGNPMMYDPVMNTTTFQPARRKEPCCWCCYGCCWVHGPRSGPTRQLRHDHQS